LNKIVLVNPKTGLDIGGSLSPPHSLLSLAAELVGDFDVKIIDQRIDSDWKKHLIKNLRESCCIGITSMCGQQIKYGLEASRLVKNIAPDVAIVWGGMHPTFFPEQTLKNRNIDLVIRSEGEKTFYELAQLLYKGKKDVKDLKKIKGLSFKDGKNIIQNPDRNYFDLNLLKETPWNLINVKKYIQKSKFLKNSKRELDIGMTTRGCTHSCGFCATSAFYKHRWRAISAEKTAEMIVNNAQRFNLDAVWLRDDEFFLDLKRADKIAQLLIKEKFDIRWYTSGIRIDTFNRMSDQQLNNIKRSGCESFRFGVETGSERLLQLINKGISVQNVISANKRARKNKIIPYYSFMLGIPSETTKESIQSVMLARRLKKENNLAKLVEFSMFIPLPGTPLFDLCIKAGLKVPNKLEDWINVDHFNSISKVAEIPYLRKKDLKIMKNILQTSIITSDMVWDILPTAYKIGLFPIKQWAKFRWNALSFKHMPEINLWTYLSEKFLGSN